MQGLVRRSPNRVSTQWPAAKIQRKPVAPAAGQTAVGREFLQPAEEPEEHIQAQFEQRLQEIRSGHKSWLHPEFPYRNSHRSGLPAFWMPPWKAISRLVAWQGYPGT